MPTGRCFFCQVVVTHTGSCWLDQRKCPSPLCDQVLRGEEGVSLLWLTGGRGEAELGCCSLPQASNFSHHTPSHVPLLQWWRNDFWSHSPSMQMCAKSALVQRHIFHLLGVGDPSSSRGQGCWPWPRSTCTARGPKSFTCGLLMGTLSPSLTLSFSFPPGRSLLRKVVRSGWLLPVEFAF